MAFITFADEPPMTLTFKVDVRFHFYEDDDGLWGQCKRCGEQIGFGKYAHPSGIEEAQILHECLGAANGARPPGDDQTASPHTEPPLVFMGIPPR
jgi:hypothetical protein